MSKKCTNCNQPARPDRVQCQTCADRNKKREDKRVAQGYCIQTSCYNIPESGKARCPSCTKRRSKYDKRIRQQRNTPGICNQCGESHNEATKTCGPCKKKLLERQHKKNFGGNRNAVIERDEGLCQSCGKVANIIHHIDNTGIGGKFKTGVSGRLRDDINNSLDNLIVLCKRCHADIHRLGNRKTRAVAAYILRVPRGSDPLALSRSNTKGWRPIKSRILARDSERCILCQNKEGTLVIHHKDDCGLRAENPNNDPSNLVTLCRGCHAAITNQRNNSDTQMTASLVLALGPGTTGTPV